MRVLDLFSGIGGFSLGLESAGMETVAFCEKDSFCRKVLTQHWPNVPIHEDIRDLDGRIYRGTVDVVCGGFPCQPFSVAGLRQGKDDDRHLWPEMLRVIRESQPRWVIGENVSGFIRMALDDVCADLEREGYEVRTFVLPACAVDARHRRDRVWIVGYTSSEYRRRDTDGRRSQGVEVGGHLLEEAGRLEVSDSVDRSSADVAHPDELRLEEHGHGESTQSVKAGQRPRPVAHPDSERELQRERSQPEIGGRSSNGSEEGRTVPDTYDQGLQGRQESRDTRGEGQTAHQQPPRLGEFGSGGDWPPEPTLPRMAHGVPHRVDRVKTLGNSVVPRLVEVIGKIVVSLDESYGTLYEE
jgi:DNA (cytosine-5)-methyltransferase 1